MPMRNVMNHTVAWMRSTPLVRALARKAVWLIPDKPRTIHSPEIGPLRIRMRRHRWLLWERVGQTDGGMLGVFRRMIRPDDCVYDIGANIGLYTRMMRQWYSAGDLVCFEPMQENFELLHANVQLGAMATEHERASTAPRAILYRMALSDEQGEQALQIDDMNSGEAVLDSIAHGQASGGRAQFGLAPKTEMVQVMRLDDLVARDNLPPPDFIKIDTEGAEVKVLRGAMHTLRTHRPRLAIALHGPELACEAIGILDELGYHTYGLVTPVGGAHAGSVKWCRIREGDAPNLTNNNIVASMNEDDVRDEILPEDARTASANPRGSD